MLYLAKRTHAPLLERYVAQFTNDTLICGLAFYETCANADEYLRLMEAWHLDKELPSGIVGSSLYLEIQEGQIVGVISVRHELNEYLRRIGGHIGYSVLPSMRRKGIAKSMLKQIVRIAAQEHGLTTCLVSCRKDNLASRRTILSCGGVLLRKETDNDITYEMYEIGG